MYTCKGIIECTKYFIIRKKKEAYVHIRFVVDRGSGPLTCKRKRQHNRVKQMHKDIFVLGLNTTKTNEQEKQ